MRVSPNVRVAHPVQDYDMLDEGATLNPFESCSHVRVDPIQDYDRLSLGKLLTLESKS